MPCGQSFGCDGRCRLTGICPDYAKLQRGAQDYANPSLAGVVDNYRTEWHPDPMVGFRVRRATQRREMTAADLGLLPSLRDRIRSAIEPYLSGPADSEHGLGMEDMARQIARVLEQDAT
jgi:hypothetical protein